MGDQISKIYSSLRTVTWLVLFLFLSNAYADRRSSGSAPDESKVKVPMGVTDLNEYRMQVKLRQFVGTYVFGGGNGETEDATLVVEDGFLQLWYLVGGNTPSSSFRIPLSSLGKKITGTREITRGVVLVEQENSIVGNEAIRFETLTSRTWKSIEREVLRIEGGELINERTRKYFKRQFLFWGPWIEDNTSFDGLRNTLDQKINMLKLSPLPISLRNFFDAAWARPSQYIRLNGSVSSSEDVRGAIERGEYEIVSGESLSGNERPVSAGQIGAQVLSLDEFRLSKAKCESLLEKPLP